MAIKFNGTNIPSSYKITYNGNTVRTVKYGNTVVWTGQNPILDGNNSTKQSWYGYALNENFTWATKLLTLGTADSVSSVFGNVEGRVISNSNKTFTLWGRHSTVSDNSIFFRASGKIDLTPYTKITITYNRTGDAIGTRPIRVVTSSTHPTNKDTISSVANVRLSKTATGDQTAEMNISSVNGEYYVGIQWQISNSGGTSVYDEQFVIKKIILS